MFHAFCIILFLNQSYSVKLKTSKCKLNEIIILYFVSNAIARAGNQYKLDDRKR